MNIRNSCGRLALVTLALIVLCHAFAQAQAKPEKEYLVYVLSEAADKIALVRFGPGGARVDREIDTGDMPVDIDGPHGIVISPDRQFYYVSIAHGRPFGTVWKYSTKDDAVVGKTTLGYFPATMDIYARRQFSFCRQLQSTWRHGAVVSFSGVDSDDDGSCANTDVHDAAWLACEFAGDEAIFRVHDGRHAGGD